MTALRYTNEHGELYTFPDKLYRVSIDCNQLLDANFESLEVPFFSEAFVNALSTTSGCPLPHTLALSISA